MSDINIDAIGRLLFFGIMGAGTLIWGIATTKIGIDILIHEDLMVGAIVLWVSVIITFCLCVLWADEWRRR